jgi:hypothetical protein
MNGFISFDVYWYQSLLIWIYMTKIHKHVSEKEDEESPVKQ